MITEASNGLEACCLLQAFRASCHSAAQEKGRSGSEILSIQRKVGSSVDSRHSHSGPYSRLEKFGIDIPSVEATVEGNPRANNNDAQGAQGHDRRGPRSVQGAQRTQTGAQDKCQEDEARTDLNRRVLLGEARDELREGSREIRGGQSADAESKDRRTLNPQRHRVESEQRICNIRRWGRVHELPPHGEGRDDDELYRQRLDNRKWPQVTLMVGGVAGNACPDETSDDVHGECDTGVQCNRPAVFTRRDPEEDHVPGHDACEHSAQAYQSDGVDRASDERERDDEGVASSFASPER